MNNYSLDFAANTITITADFAKALNDPDSAEYKLIRQLRSDFPEMQIKNKTHARPKRYRNRSSVCTACNQFKNLTYARMEQFMQALPNSETYLEEYRFLRESAAAVQHSGYALVRRWFMEQFPEFRTNPLVYLSKEPEPIDGCEYIRKHNAANQKKSA